MFHKVLHVEGGCGSDSPGFTGRCNLSKSRRTDGNGNLTGEFNRNVVRLARIYELKTKSYQVKNV